MFVLHLNEKNKKSTKKSGHSWVVLWGAPGDNVAASRAYRRLYLLGSSVTFSPTTPPGHSRVCLTKYYAGKTQNDLVVL